MSDEQVSVKEAAIRLGVTTRTVRLWLTSGKLSGERVRGRFGPEWRILADDVDRVRERAAETALVTDPAGKPGGNEFRATLAILFQEHSALEARVGEQVQQIAAGLTRLESFAPVLERANGEFETLRAQNQSLQRAMAEAMHQRQREGQELQVSLQGISALLQEQRDLLTEVRARLQALERPPLPWWRRVLGRRAEGR